MAVASRRTPIRMATQLLSPSSIAKVAMAAATAAVMVVAMAAAMAEVIAAVTVAAMVVAVGRVNAVAASMAACPWAAAALIHRSATT